MTKPRTEIEKLTAGRFDVLPKAYEKSVVLGGGVVLFPVSDPEGTAEILTTYANRIARSAYRAGIQAAREQMREAIFG